MKIAFTHNLQLSLSEDEAEFDRPETVAVITEALRSSGHIVEPLDVSGPASRVVAKLEALAPDIVFNTAEGTQGRFREAFYPALFDRLGLPFTFADAYVCTLTLDKQLTKMLVKQNGVLTPNWVFVKTIGEIKNNGFDLDFPLIVKPNFEGSSKGITKDSIVETFDRLISQAEMLLAKYPEGLIIEEFIEGSDLTVPFLEKISPETCGILEPAQYCYDIKNGTDKNYQIYDYELKSVNYDSVHVKVPADISPSQKTNVINISKKVLNAISIRDAARIDYRVGNDGRIYFIEVNALPGLEPGASMYESAALAGFDSVEKVINVIIQSAAERFNITTSRTRKAARRGKVKVGLAYNLRRLSNSTEYSVDDEAEYDSEDTITAMKNAIESYGHDVVLLEATPELPSILPASGVDVVFNIAEGIEGRTRESQVPALLELLGIPYTGSDPTTLSLSLDKGVAKRLVMQAGFLTPPFMVMNSGKERLPKNFIFPAILKPIAEGSSKGIFRASVVENDEQLRKIAGEIAGKYRQPVLVESFLKGREFTVALIGEKRPHVLPLMEVIFTDQKEKYPIYSFESKFASKGISLKVPAKLTNNLKREIESVSRNIFSVLGCRDLARIDLRLDETGKVHFIECNPLPGLTPDFSDFCVMAKAAGMTYRTLIGEILAPALRRMRERQKERLISGRFL